MSILSLMSPLELGLSLAVVALAGLVKGMVGFAMPMISIAGLSTFLPPEVALAGLIVPTLVTNIVQSLRQGVRAALASIRRFRLFALTVCVLIVFSAQLVRVLPDTVLFLVLGVPVALFTLLMILGVRFHVPQQKPWIDVSVGAFAGFVGGMSGVWGPPTVLYLTAMDIPKAEHLRVQGVLYAIGAMLLLLAHTGSGVIRAETLPFSVLLVLPAMMGMWIGGRLQDRIDQATFRRATLLVLLLAALNLIRRGLMG